WHEAGGHRGINIQERLAHLRTYFEYPIGNGRANPSVIRQFTAGSMQFFTVFSSTPAASPRQPAWAAATPLSEANTTGRQSAVRMASTRPGVIVMLASNGPVALAPASSASS